MFRYPKWPTESDFGFIFCPFSLQTATKGCPTVATTTTARIENFQRFQPRNVVQPTADPFSEWIKFTAEFAGGRQSHNITGRQ